MKTMKKLMIILSIVAVVLSSCNSSGKKKIDLSGAGATFPQPYYNLAFKSFQQKSGTAISYGAIGSGGGIRSLKDGIVDFAGSDAYLSDDEAAEMKAVIHIPSCLGAVVLSYNLPGIDKLNLTGPIVAAIFMGKITKWNDPQIMAINEGISLPDKSITAVYRSDGSGTTYVFSDYMTKISPEWKEQIGTGKSLNFPIGIASKGNPGVAGTISQTEGSIGYIGSEYAFALKTTIANLQNPAGEFITPSAASISAAAQGDIPEDTRTMITNSTAPGAYPISCFTWLLVYQEQNYSKRTIEQAQATVDLMKYMIGDEAQSLTTQIHYAPLPQGVKEKAAKAIAKITYNGNPLK